MKIITTSTIDGDINVPVYSYNEIPYLNIALECAESKKRAVSYLEIPCAFDIETTNIYERYIDGKFIGQIKSEPAPYAFMYHWQLCIGYRVIFGRRWEEFVNCLKMIESNMNLSNHLRLVIYVHNLSYEMQFMRKFLRVTDSFCKDDRHPLKILHNDCIEFRCSYALSNMSLQMFCKAENAKFYKLVDNFDYSKIRTYSTILSNEEEGYCYNDVRGLSECIDSLMKFDTLATMPLTSTGYVRREARISMRKNKKNRRIFCDSALDADLYKKCRIAFRGGDTHAAARYSNQAIRNVTSIDISSSYPACMMINLFPMSKFIPVKLSTYIKLKQREGKYVFLLHIALQNIRCTAPHMIPYIALAKTSYVSPDRILDNGRILQASELTMWCTNIDWDIIKKEYSISKAYIEQIYCSHAELLPDEYRQTVKDYFVTKTKLKGCEDVESLYYYGKSKNKLNALYGMMCMRIDNQLVTYTGNGESGYTISEIPVNELLEKYYKSRNSFLPYQWGLFVTAHARKRLRDMMFLIGRDVVYIDTDSVKMINYERHKDDIDTFNEKLKQEAIDAGAHAEDRNSNIHYMGVFEDDGYYDEFKTLGAKKYVVNINGQCYSTIAGVNKKAGQKFFSEHGINAFAIGTKIENSGHLVAYYNDDNIHKITVNGDTFTTASNIALIDDSYTLGVTDDYLSLLKNVKDGKFDISD